MCRTWFQENVAVHNCNALCIAISQAEIGYFYVTVVTAQCYSGDLTDFVLFVSRFMVDFHMAVWQAVKGVFRTQLLKDVFSTSVKPHGERCRKLACRRIITMMPICTNTQGKKMFFAHEIL
jgi:hypothetical protein